MEGTYRRKPERCLSADINERTDRRAFTPSSLVPREDTMQRVHQLTGFLKPRTVDIEQVSSTHAKVTPQTL